MSVADAVTLPPFNPAGAKILVVDDDRVNVRILRGILQTAGYVIAEAATGEEALAQCADFQPELVLLDVVLPGIDGFATCRELFKRHGKATPPVIFITAKNATDDIVEGLDAGGVDYVPKPFRQNEVLARIRTHLQMRRLVAGQRALVEQLSRANEAKNKFLGMEAHDLRNPLASIRGLAEFMRDGVVGELTPDQLDLVNTMYQASQSMLDLVNDLLDVATIESGELRLTLAPTALVELIEKAVALSAMESNRKQTSVLFAAPAARVGMTLPLDAAKMRQVLDNLLSNAVKYSPPGSTVTVELRAGGGQCEFSVKDQGPGIPDSERDKLFKDFGRLSAKPTGGEKSTGLGLAICRKIVEAHGGTIVAENLPDGGCEFRVTLPCSPAL